MDRRMLVLVSKLLLLLFLLILAPSVIAKKDVRFVGTFSSLTYNEQSGDLNGYEVHLIPTNQGLKAVVQVAEGDAGRLYIVDAITKGKEIEFSIPLATGAVGVFKGRVNSDGIDGLISFPSGSVEKVFIKRARSYWGK